MNRENVALKTDEMIVLSVGTVSVMGSINHALDGHAQWCHLANMVENCVWWLLEPSLGLSPGVATFPNDSGLSCYNKCHVFLFDFNRPVFTTKSHYTATVSMKHSQ